MKNTMQFCFNSCVKKECINCKHLVISKNEISEDKVVISCNAIRIALIVNDKDDGKKLLLQKAKLCNELVKEFGEFTLFTLEHNKVEAYLKSGIDEDVFGINVILVDIRKVNYKEFIYLMKFSYALDEEINIPVITIDINDCKIIPISEEELHELYNKTYNYIAEKWAGRVLLNSQYGTLPDNDEFVNHKYENLTELVKALNTPECWRNKRQPPSTYFNELLSNQLEKTINKPITGQMREYKKNPNLQEYWNGERWNLLK